MVVVVTVRPLDDRLAVSLPVWLRIPGLAVAVVGAVVTVSCIATFAFAGRGTPAPFDPPKNFVAVGPYRWVRNPMYLGAATVIAGAGLMLSSISTLLVTVFFLLLTHLFVIFYEEPNLQRRFGGSYREYKALVNRWLPRR